MSPKTYMERMEFLPGGIYIDPQAVGRYLRPLLSLDIHAEASFEEGMSLREEDARSIDARSNSSENKRSELYFGNDMFKQVLDVFQKEIEPKAAFIFTEIQPSSNRLITREGFVLLPYKHPLFNRTDYAFLFAVTLGSRIEEWMLEFFKAKEYLAGHLLEAIGLAALREIEQRLRDRLRMDYLGSARVDNPAKIVLSHTLSPGCQGIPLDAQIELYKLTEAYKIGITLQSDLSLYPLKSLTGIVSAGQNLPSFQKDECLYCNRKLDCLYRDI